MNQNKTIPAIYGSISDIGFNMNNIFIKDGNDWYMKNSRFEKQSEYDMYIMNENGMYKSLPIEYEYKDQDSCILYFESDQRQMVFDQRSWLLENEFQIFSNTPKIWYKLGKKVELNKLRVSLKDPIFLKIKEFWNLNIGSFNDYITWGTLLTTILAPVEYIAVYIAAKKRFRFTTEEEFQKDSEFRLNRLNTEEEKSQTKTILLKEFGIRLT